MSPAWTGRLAALALGLVLVAGLEGLLRLLGVAEPPPLVRPLVQQEDQTLYTINPDYPRRFFQGVADGHSLAGVRMAPRPFVEPGEGDLFRVVVVGGSTVQGFPHPKRLTAASYLETMLQDIWPERQIEVFNLGITAVSSFAVARCVEAAADLAPDLVVVYTGHNEFYGVYGAASLQQGGDSIWLKRWHYRLMQWRLTRLLQRLPAGSGSAEAPESLLQVMAEAGQVALEDPRRQSAAANLANNLSDVADFCRQRQIPLMLCTVASNLSDFAPAADDPLLEARQLAQWRNRIEQADSLASMAAGTAGTTAAEQGLALLDANAQVAVSARLQFVRGRLLQQLGRDAEARAAFDLALDRDRVPFRAPTAFNRVIREVAADKGCLLADVAAAFERASPGGSPGWDLMADHVHPSTAGQILLARTLIQTLADRGDAYPVNPEALLRLQPDEVYRSRMGDSPLEQLRVHQAMAQLLSEGPLERGHRRRVAELVEEGRALWESLLPAERAALEHWQTRQGDEPLPLTVADHLFSTGDLVAARRYYRASQLERPFTVRGDLWATLRWARCAQLGRPLAPAEVEAVEAADRRARLLAALPGANQALFTFFKGYSRHLAGDGGQALVLLEKTAADPGVRRTFFHDLLWLLCEGLGDRGRYAEAETYVRQISAQVGQEQLGRQLLDWLAEHRNRERR